jgi:glutamine synthetase type III
MPFGILCIDDRCGFLSLMTQLASNSHRQLLKDELEHVPAGDSGSAQRQFRDLFRKLRQGELARNSDHDAMDAIEQAAYQVRQAAGDRDLPLDYDRSWFISR